MKKHRLTSQTTNRITWALLALVVIGGFMLFSYYTDRRDNPPHSINWDLSRSHTMQDVSWPDPSTSAMELRPIESVRIKFSDSRELHETSGIRRLAIDRGFKVYNQENQISDLAVYSEPLTVDDGYKLALRWCKQWDIPAKAIDEWHATGGKTFNHPAFDSRKKIDFDHPEVSILPLYSFEDDKTVIMSLQFSWSEHANMP
ncbi:MAG TPA: hypothetical protein VMR98_04535 [Candidatus Polarisedimenticolaceae bacterium]|nr:hypothetical protein [Candidatus Polarisedimenticolaceae bacterium]